MLDVALLTCCNARCILLCLLIPTICYFSLQCKLYIAVCCNADVSVCCIPNFMLLYVDLFTICCCMLLSCLFVAVCCIADCKLMLAVIIIICVL